MNHARTVVLMLAVSASAAGYSATVLDECPAEKYKPCASFTTSRTVEEHTPLAENSLGGFVRSKGRWTIHVGYGPSETCAKVTLTVDMGPLDFHRTYERVFRNGRGVIGDRGSFLHPVDDVESALRVLTSRCRVPDTANSGGLDEKGEDREEWESERERLASEEKRERQALEAERLRLEWEAERERLALEEARERQALEAERLRLEWESERERQDEQRRLAQAREKERERQKLARERQRTDEALAQQQRERERTAQLLREQEQPNTAAHESALGSIITGLGLGALVGSAITGDDEVFDAAASLLSQSVGSTYVPSDSYSSAGSGCEQIGLRMAQGLERLNNSNTGLCAMYRGTAQVYRQTRNELTAAGCPMAGFDEAIRQAEAGARGACE